MSVLVTGHRGFIGAQVFLTLRKNGIEPLGYDIGDQPVEGRYDYIVHMGARTLIRNSVKAPFEYFNDNLGLTLIFLEMARKHDSNIVIPTSGSIQKPSNPYSMSKKQIVEWVSLYRELYGVKVHLLRFYNIYGPTSRKGAVYLFTKAALCGETAIIYGDGNHVRDFVHVRDVANLINDIVDGKLSPGDFEVGTGLGTSVHELLHLVETVTGRKLETSVEPYLLEEADTLVASKTVLSSFISLRAGIKEVFENLMTCEVC